MVTLSRDKELFKNSIGAAAGGGQHVDIKNSSTPTSKKHGRFYLTWAVGMSGVSVLMLLQSTLVSKVMNRSNGVASDFARSKPQISAGLVPTISNQQLQDTRTSNEPKVVTAFFESPDTLQGDRHPLPRRTSHRSRLRKKEFHSVNSCETLTQDFGNAIVNSFANSSVDDPWLPWLHDFFLSNDKSHLVFVAQNKRNCDTGKDRLETMKFWEPQVALFQPVPVARTDHENGTSSFRLAGDADEPILHNSQDEVTIIPETRFLCRFHSNDGGSNPESTSVAASRFSFNYEYVSWRKSLPMIKEGDHSRSEFWISQLIFYCDIPPQFQSALQSFPSSDPGLWVDVIPIRTPARYKFWLTPQMVGPTFYQQHQSSTHFFDAKKAYGNRHLLPPIADSGRWANLPVCPERPSAEPSPRSADRATESNKPYHMVLCTWTSASYHRRGEDNDQPMDDTILRLREWLIFHRMVGFEHVVIYDNTRGIDDYNQSPIYNLLQEFPKSFVTHQPWPAFICNNHRPGHPNPGDRSSQYAAEASCRERYGPLTTWMAFIDTDEYLTPMSKSENTADTTWRPVLAVSTVIPTCCCVIVS